MAKRTYPRTDSVSTPLLDLVCEVEGWIICNAAEGAAEIQRDDEAGIFASDDEAQEHVKLCAAAGSAVHKTALQRAPTISPADEMARLLEAVSRVADTTDPEHDSYLDSGADSIDLLLELQEPIAAALARHKAVAS